MPMAFNFSRASQMKFVVLAVFLSVILKFKYVGIKTMSESDYASSNPVPVASSSSSFPIPGLQVKHDVFVSFRGTDIRQGLLSHLIMALHRKQIVAFVDDRMEKGGEIERTLYGAIERSIISLIIFSQDYASSHWCLDELVKIVECRKNDGQIVIPIFYNVDPTDVRHQKRTFGNAFAVLEKKYDKIKVQKWRSALKEAANLAGFHASNFGNDAELLEEIVKSVSMRLNHMHQVNSKGLFGIGRQIANVESLLRQESEDVRVIGIWGMGGIGKTTIAEEVFNRLCSEYEGCCFLANVREESRRHGIISLKNELFSTLLAKDDLNINTPSGLPRYVEKRIGRMKVLVVVDDVNDSQQLEILVGRHDCFGSGSRIIVTTRDKQVLAKEVDDVYEVEALGTDEALQLFNLNAFKQNNLAMQCCDYELSKRVVNYSKGIPLVLKVLGHLLCGKEKAIWESQLEKLKRMPSKKVHDIMRLSYDDLDREEQKIFLDIACFFNGLNLKVDYIKILLKDQDYYSVATGLERLKDKALITISKENVISMHDIIQEMAWEIVRQESIENPRSQSRLWDADDVYQVLKYNMGTEAIRSINVHLSGVKKLQLRPRVFSKMNKLKFLDFYSKNYQDRLHLPQGLLSLPTELRYLRWMHYPLKSLPKKFSAEKLVMLDLPYSQVEKLWHGVKNVVNLKVVKLYFSVHLKDLPDLSKATNLEVMDLSFCVGLRRVHPSVFSLDKLEVLDLSWCTHLTSLKSHVHLSSLRYLTLRGCIELTKFSVTSENLIELDLQFTSINELPSSIGILSKLEKLRLANSDIETLPGSIKHLIGLRYLDLRYCRVLQTLPLLPPSIERLDADGCTSLRRIVFPSTTAEQLKENRKRVTFWNCLNLDEYSLWAIGLNAQINIMKFAYQHVSALELLDCVEFYYEDVDEEYCIKDYDAKVTYVYPGSRVPGWLVYRTTKDYITIDLSSPPLCNSSQVGFIFSFIVPRVPSDGLSLKLSISVEGEGEGESRINMYMDRPRYWITSDHVCLMYDQRCSRFLHNRAKDLRRFKIKVTAYSLVMGTSEYMQVLLKGFGVRPINASEYHNFLQQMELVDVTGPADVAHDQADESATATRRSHVITENTTKSIVANGHVAVDLESNDLPQTLSVQGTQQSVEGVSVLD